MESKCTCIVAKSTEGNEVMMVNGCPTHDPIYRTTIAPKEEEWKVRVKDLAKGYANASYLVSEESHPVEEEIIALDSLVSFIKENFIPKERIEKMMLEIEHYQRINKNLSRKETAGWEQGYEKGLQRALEILPLLSEDK